MDKLRIYLVDDHKLFREGLKLLLSTQDFVRHIYEASNGREFIENLSFVDCDVVLMDIEMPEMNGIDATIEAMKMKPNLKIIVLSMYGDEPSDDRLSTVAAGYLNRLQKSSHSSISQ